MTSFQAVEKLLNPSFQSQSVPRMRAHWYINAILPPENISFTDNMEDNIFPCITNLLWMLETLEIFLIKRINNSNNRQGKSLQNIV